MKGFIKFWRLLIVVGNQEPINYIKIEKCKYRNYKEGRNREPIHHCDEYCIENYSVPNENVIFRPTIEIYILLNRFTFGSPLFSTKTGIYKTLV